MVALRQDKEHTDILLERRCSLQPVRTAFDEIAQREVVVVLAEYRSAGGLDCLDSGLGCA